jgi:hypothetical protein
MVPEAFAARVARGEHNGMRRSSISGPSARTASTVMTDAQTVLRENHGHRTDQNSTRLPPCPKRNRGPGILANSLIKLKQDRAA